MNENMFSRIDTNKKPRKYIHELLESIRADRVKEAKVGELITFALPPDKDFAISYVGEKPEKYCVEDDVLTITMTDCGLVFIYSDGGIKKMVVVVAK